MVGSPQRPDTPAGRSGFSRSANLDRLRSEHFDVVVIGGGITGAGVALDAASRGLATALVEKADFASGTSSKSSKLVHGGIRYLQQREFALVYQNLAERQRLLTNAGHLVSPLPFLIPLFGSAGAVSKTLSRSYSVALWLYDMTGGFRIGKRHRRVSRAEAVAHFPVLDTNHLVAGFLYFDARADDARLTLAVLRTAVDQHRATAVNYAPVVGFTRGADGALNGVSVCDLERNGEPAFDVSARVVINATGVWTDAIRRLGAADLGRSLRPAKGVHVTVLASRFPADIAAVIPVRKDRRSVFVVPWPEADLVYLGTTDTTYDGPLDDPKCTEEDVAYLLDAANSVSSAGLTSADVTAVWAGLRPLLSPPPGRKVSERTADLSRRHKVWRDPDGLITVTGGKLTTYRKMAEDTVNAAVRALGGPARRCVTKTMALEGAPDHRAASSGARSSGLAHLEARYGTLAPRVLALAQGRAELLEPVVDGLPYVGAEVLYAAREEMAVQLADVLYRRTRAGIQDARASVRAAPAVAAILAAELGWDDGRQRAEVDRFVAEITADLDAAGLVNAEDAGASVE